ncbi:MAG: MATE family efflux transporter [Clostridia bacterium]|nr:MATE family efflux transporter [Clostridia bacterium]
MAWPSVVESFLVALVGFVDTIMVSSLGSYAIAAVGLTTQPKFIGLCLFMSMSTAISALVARRRGEENRESAVRILRMCLGVALVLTVIVTILALVFADPILRFAGSKDDTHEAAVEYFRIIMGGIIFTTITLTINAAQRGAGNTKLSMRTNVVSNLVNVLFNYLLIGGNLGFPALGIRGAAIATVIGSVFGCGMSIFSLFSKQSFVYIRGIKGYIASKIDIKSLLNVGSSAFTEQIFFRIGFLLFAITVANLGTTAYAAHQIGMNMMSLSFSFADGFSVASVALIGRSLGQKRRDLAKLYANMCQRMGLVCAFLMSLVFLFFGRGLFSLFSSDPAILDMGVMIMRILCFVIYLQITQVIFFGCLRGAGDTKFTAFASMLSVAIIRPGVSWLLCNPLGLGLLGVWLGLVGDQLTRFSLGFFRIKQGNWLKIKL